MDEFRRPDNNSTEITSHESDQRLSPIMKDSSSSAFSKPILPSTSSLLPPKLQFAPPLLNGSIKFGSPSNNPIPEPTSPSTSYRECHRNHAASVGGHVTDGCGEFMPAGFADPLKCMACECHRSFHRKESEPDLIINDYKYQSSSEEKVERGRNGNGRRKRFRTKFSEEQKEKMKGFGERVGWRVQKKDDGEMDRFCKGLGINRQALRVWMHNNRHFFNNDDGKQERRGIKVDKVLLRPQP